MTLAHELGHWLFGDAYDTQVWLDNEQMINSFAIHFLAPRAGVAKVWSEHNDLFLRDRALAVGVVFRLSWSATISQLQNIELLSHEDRERLITTEPRSGDYLRLGQSWTDELEYPYLSPGFIAACLAGYTLPKHTEARVLELLRGLLSADDLPPWTRLHWTPFVDRSRGTLARDRMPDAAGHCASRSPRRPAPRHLWLVVEAYVSLFTFDRDRAIQVATYRSC